MIWLLALPASAATWWVADEGEAGILATALADVWPQHTLEIAIGLPMPAVDPVYLYVEEGTLFLVAPGSPVRRADVDDWWTRAVLARSWLRGVARPPAPPLPADEPPPLPPAPEPPPSRPGIWGVGTLGAGYRYPDSRPVVRAAVAAGGQLGRVGLGFGADAELGDVTRWGFGLEGLVDLAHTPSWTVAWTVGPVLRWTAEDRGWTGGWTTGIALGLRGPSLVQPTFRFGVAADPQQGRPIAAIFAVGARMGPP